jgi:hypothetical protein
MVRRGKDRAPQTHADSPPAVAALREWRIAERARRAQREQREKERLRRKAAAAKRALRREQDAALRVEQAARAVAQTRAALEGEEQAALARIKEINARRLVTVKSIATVVLLAVLAIAPQLVVGYYQVHKLPADQALVLGLGVLMSYSVAVVGTFFWIDCWLLPVLARSSALAEAVRSLDAIVRKRKMLTEGRYRLDRPARVYRRWPDTPFVIRFD